ncbi:MAG TPA: glutamine--fructose-6-phosphate transaminase (isomerizing) [bacterium]|nr:glutamine--fructose-6-phosphate transaminase (isomerizing) [bacterium]
MCGIAGYTGPKPAIPILLGGLAKLEYRGYDSAGLALLTPAGKMRILKKAGKIGNLVAAVKKAGLDPSLHAGIGHTRWATHGHPTDQNAHPHTDCSGSIAVVHNGIIENYQKLKSELTARGHRFKSQTDSEVLAHLIEEGLRKKSWEAAVRWALSRITGTYSVVAVCEAAPRTLIGARSGGGALVVGLGQGENFIASDVPALLSHTQKVFYLDDDEMAVVTPEGAAVVGIQDGKARAKEPTRVDWTAEQAEKGGYPHFMLKEIFEQPRALEDTLTGRLDPRSGEVVLEGGFVRAPWAERFQKITLLACGTSYYAGLVGKFLLEEQLRVPVEVDYASEFRYRRPVLGPDHLAVVITQSGETVDTLVALREAKARGAKVVAICNVMGSSATREADAVLLTRAGPEIGVASTKAFTTQLEALWLLSLHLARVRRSLPPKALRQKGLALARIPTLATAALKQRKAVEKIARRFAPHYNFLYLGRGINYPIALEGALKLKEISYIHAEGYPGGEMKHGPIALIDQRLPVVAIALRSSGVYEKMLNNMEEVKARSGKLLAVVEKGDKLAARKADAVLEIPPCPEDLSPILSVLPLQLLAYEIARLKGREIDQPRNLAKSVTVE